MEQRSHPPGEDPERKKELRELARLLNEGAEPDSIEVPSEEPQEPEPPPSEGETQLEIPRPPAADEEPAPEAPEPGLSAELEREIEEAVEAALPEPEREPEPEAPEPEHAPELSPEEERAIEEALEASLPQPLEPEPVEPVTPTIEEALDAILPEEPVAPAATPLSPEEERAIEEALEAALPEEAVAITAEEEIEQAVEAALPEPRSGNGLDRSGLVAGRFEIVSLIGGGPHGGMWRVRDRDVHGRELALKILREQWTRAANSESLFRSHLDQSKRLKHVTINRLRDVGKTEDGRIWLAWDLVPGETLRATLQKKGALPPRQALEVARQMLEGLERGHALGFVHGGLDLEHVALIDRVPWSEENPFSVGVRMLDYGIRPLLEGGKSPGVREDLFAVGIVLAELLSGSRLSPDGSNWMGSGESKITASLASGTRTMLDTALSADPKVRYKSAAEFRTALERSTEWRVRSRRPSLAAVAGFVILIGASSIAAVWLRGFFTGDGVQAADSPSVAREDVDRLQRELEDSRATNSTELSRLADQVTSLRGDVDEANTEIDHLRTTGDTWRQRAEEAAAERDRLAAEKDVVQEDATGLESDLQTMRRRLAALESTRAVPERASPQGGDPGLRAAGYVEQLLSRVSDADGVGAVGVVEAFRKDAVLRQAKVGGTVFLESWSRALVAWQRLVLEADELQRVALLEEANRALNNASERRATFDLIAAEWLELPLTSGQMPERGTRIDLSLETLRGRLERAKVDLEAGFHAGWNAIEAGATREPGEVVAIGRWFDDDRLRRHLGKLTDELRTSVVKEGSLDLAELENQRSLPAWAEVVGKDPELQFLPEGGELLLFAYAQRYYSPPDESEVLPPGPVRFLAGETGDWREELAIRTHLLGKGSPFPGPVGSRRLYHTFTPEGITSWLWETVREDFDPPEGTNESWIVEQQFLDDKGRRQAKRSVRVYLRGKRYYEKILRSSQTLDLGRIDPATEVRLWSPDDMPQAPETLPIGAGRVEDFRSLLSAGTWRCLVFRRGGAHIWYSPDLGLVRYSDPQRIVRELVYSEIPR